MTDLTLISHHLCPYVQRAAIALAEKGVSFERINVDLANKPVWFKAISPLGKVPLLKVGNEVIFESSAIIEYLEETQPNPLHPADPLKRAQHRAWIEFGSTILADLWGFYTATDGAGFQSKTATVRQKFERIEAELGGGPFFAGETFSLVDAVSAPVFRYFDLFDQLGDFGILTGLPKVAAWRAALAGRPSVQSAVPADYGPRLLQFIQEKRGYLARTVALAA